MRKMNTIALFFLPLISLFSSCEKDSIEHNSYIGPGEVEVRGELIDIRKWISGEKLFPQHNAYFVPSEAEELFEHPVKYAVSLMEYAGPTSVRAGSDCLVTIAVDLKEMPAEYIPTGKSFVAGDITYNLFELKLCAGKWAELSRPADSCCSLIVFAENLSVDCADIPGTVIAQIPELRRGAINNVSLAILPDGSYIAACTGASTKTRVSLFLSKNGGCEWNLLEDTNVAENRIRNYYNLFVHNGSLYMSGVGDGNSDILISRSDDSGRTWTVPEDGISGIIKKGTYHSSAVAVVVSGGRIWRAMEQVADGKKYPFVMSAPEDSDLLDASLWTFTNTIELGEGFNYNSHPINELIEGNMVATPDGKIYNLLRASCTATSAAGVALPVSDVVNLATPSSTWLITLPGGGKKFTVRYDPLSRKYWTITNPAASAGLKHKGIYSSGITFDLMRNRMVLLYSNDLINWVQFKEIVTDRDPFFHGFQYVDWQFDGDDIVAVCRMACPERRGLPERQHDANLMTFHRIRKFRNL